MMKTVISNGRDKFVKYISSANVDLEYAPQFMENHTKAEENDGWKRFGPLTPIYDKETNRCIFVQVLIK